MYSPKIKEDLIAVIHRKAQIVGKSMTDIVDEILRSQLMTVEDTTRYTCHNCRTEVDVIDGNKGYCDYCETIVFVDKA